MPRVRRGKTRQQLADQFDRVQTNIHASDPNYTSNRWQRFERTANRYAANIDNSRYANSTGVIPRRVYMGISRGSVAK